MRKAALLIILLVIPPVIGHTGDNHTDSELASDEHDQGDEFQFVEQDYPEQTKYIVIAEIIIVLILFLAAVVHYRNNEPKKG